MSSKYNTTKESKFQHLKYKQRVQIELLLKQRMPKTKIANEIGISRSTLYEEIKRGTVEQIDTHLKKNQVYFADAGQRVYEERRANSKKPYKIIQAFDFVKYAEKQIKENKLSPDAVCGRAKLEGKFDCMVSAKTLYNYIDKGFLAVKNIDLPLRVKRKTKHTKNRKNRRILGNSIENRPIEIDNRTTFGHWEIDTVVGKRENSSVLLTIDERLTRKRHIIKIESKTSEAVSAGLERLKERYGSDFNKVFKSITSDNGSEFSNLSEFLYDTDIYFTHPYSSFERGTNENQNSLVRRFFPKGKSLDDISEEQIIFVEDWINNLPRKILNYSTANELFSNFI